MLLTRPSSRLIVAGMVVLAACARAATPEREPRPTDEPPRKVTFTLTNNSFEVSGGIEAEPVDISLQNQTDAPHVALFARLNGGVTPEQVKEAFPKGEEAIVGLITTAGSLPRTEPGATSEATIEFPEGSYLVFDPSGRWPPPLGFFEVLAASGPAVKAPKAPFTIEAGEFYFKIDGAQAGSTIVEITNQGKLGHQVLVLEPGAELPRFFTLAPAPGGSLWASIDLEAGTYQVACFVPDPKTGKPHAQLGMQAPLTVS